MESRWLLITFPVIWSATEWCRDKCRYVFIFDLDEIIDSQHPLAVLSCQSKSSLSALVQCFWWRDGGFCSCTLAWGWCEETPKTCVPGSAIWGESFLGPDNEVRTLAPLVTMSCSLLPQQVLWLLCFFTCQNLAGEQGWVLSSIPQLFSVREFPDDSHFIRESNSVWEVEWKCLKIASACLCAAITQPRRLSRNNRKDVSEEVRAQQWSRRCAAQALLLHLCCCCCAAECWGAAGPMGTKDQGRFFECRLCWNIF